MASFLRNTFDNLVTNLNSTFNNNNSSSHPTRPNRRAQRVPADDSSPAYRFRNFRESSGRPPASTSEEQARLHRAPSGSNTNEQASRSTSQPPIGRNQANPAVYQRQTQAHHQNIYTQYPQHNNTSYSASDHNTTTTNMSSTNATHTNSSAPEKLDISDVRDPQDIKTLTTKQLKIILTRNCVDYKGVFEKEVLREKVMQLWIDCNERKTNSNRYNSYDGSQGNNSDDLDENQACKICMEREINCVLLECGHMLTCVTCGRKLAECPICRQNVTRCVRTFKG